MRCDVMKKNPRSPANGACVPCLSGSPCAVVVVVADSQGWCLETEVVMRHGDRRPKEKQKFKTRPICWKSNLLTFNKVVHDISKWIALYLIYFWSSGRSPVVLLKFFFIFLCNFHPVFWGFRWISDGFFRMDRIPATRQKVFLDYFGGKSDTTEAADSCCDIVGFWSFIYQMKNNHFFAKSWIRFFQFRLNNVNMMDDPTFPILHGIIIFVPGIKLFKTGWRLWPPTRVIILG